MINSGTYYVGAIADGYYGNNVLESDETNNALAGNHDRDHPLVRGPHHDLGDATTRNSEHGRYRYGDDNSKEPGRLGSGRLLRSDFYLSTDSTITSSDTYLKYVYVSSLAAGAETTLTTTFSVPVINSGTYYVGAIADGYYGSNVLESDETNNALAGNTIAITRFVRGPHHDLGDSNARLTANTGDTVTVTAIVKNQGGWARAASTFRSTCPRTARSRAATRI